MCECVSKNVCVCEREFKSSIIFLNGHFLKSSDNGIVFEQRFLKFGFHAKIFEPRNFQTLVFEWSLHKERFCVEDIN